MYEFRGIGVSVQFRPVAYEPGECMARQPRREETRDLLGGRRMRADFRESGPELKQGAWALALELPLLTVMFSLCI